MTSNGALAAGASSSAMRVRLQQQVATILKDLADLEKVLTEDEPEEKLTAAVPARAGLLSISEAATALRIGKTKLKQLVAEGRIGSVRIGRRRLFSRDHLREFVEGATES